jgi:chromosome segregation ATPase
MSIATSEGDHPMTTIDQALLNAIRGVVGEAVAPLTEKIGGLTDRVDGLTGRVDGLTAQVGGLTDRVDGLTGRVDGLTGRVDGLTGRVDGLTEQVGGMAVRMNRMETEQQVQRGLLHSIEERIDERFTHLDLRLTSLEAVSIRMGNEIGTIETRTGQIYSDVSDLLELQARVQEGFRAFKSDFQRAFLDISAVQESQIGYQRQMKQLRERVDRLERRLSKIEEAGGIHE